MDSNSRPKAVMEGNDLRLWLRQVVQVLTALLAKKAQRLRARQFLAQRIHTL
jgi:hypothetical protein